MDNNTNEPQTAAATNEPQTAAATNEPQTAATDTPREIALQNTLNKYIDEHKKLKEELHKLQVANEEMAIKIGLNRGSSDDILKCFSKYYRGENNGR